MLVGCKVMMSKIIGLSLTSNTATIPSEERCLGSCQSLNHVEVAMWDESNSWAVFFLQLRA